MQLRSIALLAASALPFLLADAALAQSEIYQLDPASSQVHFALPDALHAVDGVFHVQSGSLQFDRGDGAMSGAVVVSADSGDSGNKTRDKKMTDDQLKAATYSTVTFTPRHYTGALAMTGDSTITVVGVFTLLGKPHDLSVPMKVSIAGSQCTATGSFDVPYVQWGVKDPSNFLLRVGKSVTINLVLKGSLSESKKQ